MFDFVLGAKIYDLVIGEVGPVVTDDGVGYAKACDDMNPEEFDDMLGRDL